MLSLAGVRVVSLAVNLPGPVAASELWRLGASVVKVEPPNGDMMELSQPDWYAELHQGVEIHRLNLKDATERRQLDELLELADLLLTSNRPSALERLGLGWDQLHARFPRLCQVAIVGYPEGEEDLPGHDLTYQARLGLLSPPTMPKSLIADLAGAQRAVIEALALLYGRQKGQPAGCRAVSLSESARLFALPLAYGFTTPGGGLGGGLPGYNLYQAKEGWVAVGALEPHFLENLRRALELESATHEALAEVFARRTASAWEQWANEKGLPVAAVRETSTLVKEPGR
jgi:crotonobetainyl-CoA:carnitine CoA-transferase CaiB-like acyl-CoA transferase